MCSCLGAHSSYFLPLKAKLVHFQSIAALHKHNSNAISAHVIF